MKYRKKPVVIEAIRWCLDNYSDVRDFFGENLDMDDEGRCIFIKTLEGTMKAEPYDWIIKGVKGEFYPCKSDIFEATYEPVEET